MVHLTLNSLDTSLRAITTHYRLSNAFPLFVLTNSNGEVISRWAGYQNGTLFIKKLNRSLSDVTTINERVKRFSANQNYSDAISLAKYYTSSKQYQKAIHYYHELQRLQPENHDQYLIDIFRNSANASWEGELPFKQAQLAAESTLAVKGIAAKNIMTVVNMMCNLSRKKNYTGAIPRFIQAGLNATKDSPVKQLEESHKQLLADELLYITHDTASAVKQAINAQGVGWETSAFKLYRIGKYCLDRKISIKEAERYLRKAAHYATSGQLKAAIRNSQSKLNEYRGMLKEAIKLMEFAIKESPGNQYYRKELIRLRGLE